jgi:Zn-dependent peptidase ImmA (M78 family)
LKIDRLDLDGAGSPSALVTRILEVERDLPIPVPIEALCARLDIVAIEELHTDGFEAALVTDACKATGAILIAKDRSRQRRRFSIGHELGHFLIPTHMPPAEGRFLCSSADLRQLETKDQARRARMEGEANRFSALLLMPPPILRAELRRSASPDLAELVRLAELFDVSKEAMARAYASYHAEAVAIVIAKAGRVMRIYRSATRFPRLEHTIGDHVPVQSIAHEARSAIGTVSSARQCGSDLWLSDYEARTVATMTEQVLHLSGEIVYILLHAEIPDEEDHEPDYERSWRPRF